jgi:hypothetical protein
MQVGSPPQTVGQAYYRRLRQARKLIRVFGLIQERKTNMQINLNRHRSILRFAVPALAILLGLGTYGAMAQRDDSKGLLRVAIGLPTKSSTQNQLASEITRQLSAGGVSASEKEVQAAARRTLNLIAESKDPQKVVIHVKFKKFTICVSWGADKDYCSKH